MSVGTVASPATSQPAAPPRRTAVSVISHPVTIAVLALTALAAALRFYRLGHQGFWFDEANTAQLVHFSLGKMLGLIPQTESTPPLYYCVAWAWTRVFGYGEAGLRSLSAVAGVLTVPVAYGAGARLVSRRTGLIVAALCACNPFLIWYSQEARSYALLVLFSALALLSFALVLDRPTPRHVALWVVCSALALATHYYAVVVVIPQAAWLLVRLRDDRAVQAGLAVVALCGLALIPLALSQHSTGHDSWITHSDLGVRLRQIIPQFLIGTDAPARTLLKFLALALALVGLGLLGLRRRLPEGRRGLLALGLAATGFVISLAFIAAGSDALITRNIIGVWLPAAIAVAAGLALARPRVVGAVVAAGLCGIGVAAAVGVATDYKFQRPNWRVVAQELGPRPVAGSDRLILIQHYRTLLPLSLYLPHLHFVPGRGVAGVRELDVVAFSSPQQPLCWWGAACNLIPSRMQAAYHVPGFHRLWLRRVRQFTIMRLVSDRPRRVTPATVSRALHTTSLPRDELLSQH
ncbi:MAG TPA: glycosyltransferase family 39 protein [Solirubrobacteraceae bacterium]|nr:glycosyltransferase family 39 protein [Solirubrobacteraceae bacterium]